MWLFLYSERCFCILFQMQILVVKIYQKKRAAIFINLL